MFWYSGRRRYRTEAQVLLRHRAHELRVTVPARLGDVVGLAELEGVREARRVYLAKVPVKLVRIVLRELVELRRDGARQSPRTDATGSLRNVITGIMPCRKKPSRKVMTPAIRKLAPNRSMGSSQQSAFSCQLDPRRQLAAAAARAGAVTAAGCRAVAQSA